MSIGEIYSNSQDLLNSEVLAKVDEINNRLVGMRNIDVFMTLATILLSQAFKSPFEIRQMISGALHNFADSVAKFGSSGGTNACKPV